MHDGPRPALVPLPMGWPPPEPTDHQCDGFKVTYGEAARLLITLAKDMHRSPCYLPECVACNDALTIWWDWNATLPLDWRMWVQRWLRHMNIPLPNGPWTVVG